MLPRRRQPPAPALARPSYGLERSRTTAQYRLRLDQALTAFLAWCDDPDGSTLARMNPADTVDTLCAYVQHLHDHHHAYAHAKNAVIAMQELLGIRRVDFRRPWLMLSSWQAKRPLRSRLPMPVALLDMLRLLALERTQSPDAPLLWLSMMVLLPVGFYSLLRPGELLTLRLQDIMFSPSLGGGGMTGAQWCGSAASIALRTPKTRAKYARVQFATLRHQPSIRWLRWYLALFQAPSNRLWPAPRPRFNAMFAELCAACGVPPGAFTPGCLRPGGATFFFVNGIEMASLKFLGRWQSESSLESYVQEATAQAIWAQCGSQQQAQWQALISAFAQQLEAPPPVCPWTLFSARADGC